MKVCIFGAGAVGGNLAVRLARAGVRVSVVARGPHLAAIRADGLRLRNVDGETAVAVAASDTAQDLGPQDMVLITLKTTALEAAAPALAPLLDEHTTVAFVANGLPWWYLQEIESDPAAWSMPLAAMIGAMSRTVARDRVLAGVVYSANTIVEPGVVWNSGPSPNRFIFGELDGTVSARSTAIAEAVTQDGAVGVASDAIRAEIWKKLVTNVVTGPLGGLIGAPSATLLADAGLAPVAAGMVAETRAIAAACGEPDAIPPVPQQVRGVGNHKASMLQDFEAGRRPEIDSMLGCLADIGRIKSVPTPTLDVVLALLRARAAQLGLYP